MDRASSEIKTAKIVILVSLGWVLALALAWLYGPIMRIEDVMENRIKKFETVTRMRINLLKSVELEKKAVMAITDEESKAFAEQSLRASDFVEQDLHELNLFMKAGIADEEIKLINEFNECWQNCREIDKVLLNFAVQNTNLKAASLSYTKGAEALRRFENAIARLTVSDSSVTDAARIEKLFSGAIISVLKVSNLQPAHIDAVEDKQMDEIESLMKAEEDKIKSSLSTLSDIFNEQQRSIIEEAVSAFKDFSAVNSEVIRLSRQNSNIKSLELSLGRKHKAAARCEEILNTLHDAIQRETFKATR